MQIFIKLPTNQVFTLEVEPDDTILHVKKKILEKKGIPVEEQGLMFAGKKLQESFTLKEYRIERESTLNIFLNLRGGMYHASSGDTNGLGPFDELTSLAVLAEIKKFIVSSLLHSPDDQQWESFSLIVQKTLKVLPRSITSMKFNEFCQSVRVGLLVCLNISLDKNQTTQLNARLSSFFDVVS